MKNPSTYIMTELKKFVSAIPKIRIRYKYDDDAKIYFIEVVPNDVFRNDRKYILWENKLFKNFVKKFPNQHICFMSDDEPLRLEKLLGIDRIDFEIAGNRFAMQ